MNDLLERVAVNTFGDYDPAVLVHAANVLLSQGKAGVLREIERYIHDSDPTKEMTGIFWLLRVLFDIPPLGSFPPPHIGRPSVPEPPNPAALPRFPIMLVADIPLLLVRGYDLGGMPETFERELAFIREHTLLRPTPLAPVLEGAEGEFRSEWTAAYGTLPPPDELEFIRAQINRLKKSER